MTKKSSSKIITPFISKEIEETLLLAAARPAELPPRQISALREKILARIHQPNPLLARYTPESVLDKYSLKKNDPTKK